MRALVAGHLVLDSILTGGRASESIGGPPAYMGLLLRRLGFEVTVATRVGRDFGDERLAQLLSAGISFASSPIIGSPTTRFEITILPRRREMRIVSRCGDIPPPSAGHREYDIVLLNPVAGEISPKSLPRYKEASRFIYVDPQGFLRKIDEGRVTLGANTSLKGVLSVVDAMKVDVEEGRALTGMKDCRRISSELMSLGVREVLVTDGANGTFLRVGTELYHVRPPRIKAFDGVGAGDLLGAGYSAARMSRSPRDSLAFAMACASCRIDRAGLGKIPEAEEVEGMAAELIPKVETLEGLG